VNTTFGRTTVGRHNLRNALIVALVALVGLAGAFALNEALSGSGTTTPAPAPVSVAFDYVPGAGVMQYVYVVDSPAQAQLIEWAHWEAQVAANESGMWINPTIHVIDVSTPAGRAELEGLTIAMGESMALGYEVPIHIQDLRAQGAVAAGSGVTAGPATSAGVPGFDGPAPSLPTVFYLVNSPFQAATVMQEHQLLEFLWLENAIEPPYRAHVIDLSTAEGAQLFNLVNADYAALLGDPTADHSLIQIVDLTR
jgi:hypothetical protein